MILYESFALLAHANRWCTVVMCCVLVRVESSLILFCLALPIVGKF